MLKFAEMERFPRHFPNFEKRAYSDQESLESAKGAFVNLCAEMKAEIESGKYDILVGDDAGGRIPTLLLWEVMKLVAPEHKVKTLFVAAGRSPDDKENSYISAPNGLNTGRSREDDNWDSQRAYLKRGISDSKHISLVTQIMVDGRTMLLLTKALKEVGVSNIDIAALFAGSNRKLEDFEDVDRLFIGDKGNGGIYDDDTSELVNEHHILSGIAKNPMYDPRPMRLDKAIDSGVSRAEFLDREELTDYANAFPHELHILDEMSSSRKREAAMNKLEHSGDPQLTDAEKSAIQQSINLTRAHIKELAKQVVQEVWRDKGETEV